MAKLKEFQVGYSLSVELKKSWHKFNCSITLELDEGEKSSDVNKHAWTLVEDEIANQLYNKMQELGIGNNA